MSWQQFDISNISRGVDRQQGSMSIDDQVGLRRSASSIMLISPDPCCSSPSAILWFPFVPFLLPYFTVHVPLIIILPSSSYLTIIKKFIDEDSFNVLPAGLRSWQELIEPSRCIPIESVGKNLAEYAVFRVITHLSFTILFIRTLMCFVGSSWERPWKWCWPNQSFQWGCSSKSSS